MVEYEEHHVYWPIYSAENLKEQYRGDKSAVVLFNGGMRDACKLITCNSQKSALTLVFDLVRGRESGLVYNGINNAAIDMLSKFLDENNNSKMIGWQERRRTLKDIIEKEVLLPELEENFFNGLS